MHKILVSACLLGAEVRHDGRHKRADHEVLDRWRDEGRIVSACPEMLGGLGTPRPPAEITLGRVFTNAGIDVTAAFEEGARLTAEEAMLHGVRVAILKSGSPSCGSGFIYDGTFTKTRVAGDGVTASLLRARGIAIFSEEELDAAADFVAVIDAATA
jgi:uncharacterized protein YbbK (DUF523 family)